MPKEVKARSQTPGKATSAAQAADALSCKTVQTSGSYIVFFWRVERGTIWRRGACEMVRRVRGTGCFQLHVDYIRWGFPADLPVAHMVGFEAIFQ
jgi:hypothetical protein